MNRLSVKIMSLLLACITVFSLAACADGKSPDESSQSDTTVPVNPDNTEPAESEGPKLNLPDMDFGGEEFTLLCREARVKDFFIGDQTGVILDDAVFARNSLVQDTYKTKISVVTMKDDQNMFNQKLEASANAGCGDYDAVAPDYYWGCETKGYFVNLRELPYLSLDSEWWWKNWNDCYTINGKLTNAVGWLTLDIVKGMEVVYFSKAMMNDLGITEPYQSVTDKTWTLDAMMEMSKKATFNVDGKGATDPSNYCYGTILHYMGGWSILFGMGAKIAETDNEGNITLNLGTEKNEQVVSKLSDWMHSGDNDVFYAGFGDVGHNLSANENPEVTAKMFTEGHSLFYCYGLKTAELLASMDMQFGLLPPPLENSEQENYITTTFGTSYFAIERGLSKENQEFSAFMLEALNYYSYTMVKDVYYENNLKIRYASDPDTSNMVDYVVKSTFIDFGHVTNGFTGSLRDSLLSAAVSGNSLAQSWKSLKTVSKKSLEKYIEGYLQ